MLLLLSTSLMRWPMTFTCSSLHNLVDTPLTAAMFYLCTMLNTHTLTLGLFFASLMTTRFSHCLPPSTTLCASSSIVKGIAGASTRIIAYFCLHHEIGTTPHATHHWHTLEAGTAWFFGNSYIYHRQGSSGGHKTIHVFLGIVVIVTDAASWQMQPLERACCKSSWTSTGSVEFEQWWCQQIYHGSHVSWLLCCHHYCQDIVGALC